MAGHRRAGNAAGDKIAWQGSITSVQPRIRLWRSFDERGHAYLGFSLRINGSVGNEVREVWVGIGKGAQAKHQLQVGDEVSGLALPVADPRLETVELYKVSKLKVLGRFSGERPSPPPWHGIPPELGIYRDRGHRRLAARTYATSCTSCIWGANMAVEMIIDQWNPSQRRYRTETFCYGPKSCRFYKSGPTRKVPGRKGMSWEEQDWIEEEETAHRGDDE